MNGWKSIIVAFGCAFGMFLIPVRPTMWLLAARAMSYMPGWMPSMCLIAMSGCQFIFHCEIARWFRPGAAGAIGVASSLTWALISCLAIALISIRSIRCLQRLGLRSTTRFRIWFELSRLSWHLVILVVVLTLALSRVEDACKLKPFSWYIGLWSSLCLLMISAVTGLTGYVLALLRWRIPNGRAFECVNFFLPLLVPIWVMVRWPQRVDLPTAIGGILLSILGVVFFGAAFIVTIQKSQQLDGRREGWGDSWRC